MESARVVGDEGIAVAVFDDRSVLHDDYFVYVSERAESVGDDQGRSTKNECGDGSFQSCLGFGVDAGGCFVEHDQIGIAHPHPSESEELCLTCRKSSAART